MYTEDQIWLVKYKTKQLIIVYRGILLHCKYVNV